MNSRTKRQLEGVTKWAECGGVGTLVYPTGAGKTRTAIMAIQLILEKKPDLTTLIIVPTEALKNQWEANLFEFGLNGCCDVQIVNTAIKHEDTYDLMVCDEVHLYCSEQFSKIFEVIHYDYLLCLTATLERLDGREYIVKQYAPVCDEISLDEALDNGWISNYTEYKVLIDIDLTEYNNLNAKFNEYFSLWNWDFKLAMLCVTNAAYRNKYAKIIGMDVKTFSACTFEWNRLLKARKEYVRAHPKKMEVAKHILEKRCDRKSIVFCSSIREAEEFDTKYIVHSKRTKKSNASLINEFNELDHGFIVSPKALNTGIDVKGLTVGVIMSVDSSKITKTQTIGRSVRKQKFDSKAEVFTLVINNTIDNTWFNNSSTTDFVAINEKQLEDVLDGKQISTRKEDVIPDYKYRF